MIRLPAAAAMNRCCSSSHVSDSLLLYWWVAWQCSRRLLTVPLALSCLASVALRQLLLHSHAQAAAFPPLTPRHLPHLLHHCRHVSIPHALTLLLPAPPRQPLVCFAPILWRASAAQANVMCVADPAAGFSPTTYRHQAPPPPLQSPSPSSPTASPFGCF